MTAMRAGLLLVTGTAAACFSKPPDPRGCTDDRAWGTARPLPELASSGDELGPWLSPDRQDLWFSSTRESHGVYHARWNTTTRTYDPPDRVDLNPAVTTDDGEPFLSDDQTTLWYSTDPVDTDVFAASRASTATTFGASSRTAAGDIDSGVFDSGIDVTQDGTTAVFASARDGDVELYLATWSATTKTYTNVVPIPSLSHPGRDCCATLGADGTTLLFESDRGGRATIWESVRADASSPFPEPHVFEPFVGSTSVDGQPHLIRDGTAVVFSSNRGGSDFDLYIVDRCTP
jgi:Tol biopolymer transport system component